MSMIAAASCPPMIASIRLFLPCASVSSTCAPHWSSSAIMPVDPPLAQYMSGVLFSRSLTSSALDAVFPAVAALVTNKATSPAVQKDKESAPSWLTTGGSSTGSSRIFAASSWPDSSAYDKPVIPALSLWRGLAPCESSFLTLPVTPL